MLNYFLPAVISSVLTTVALVVAGVMYWQGWRRIRIARQLEANLPAATRLVRLHEEVAELETKRNSLASEIDTTTINLAEAREAKAWLATNEAKYQQVLHELPSIEAKLAVKSRDLEQARIELEGALRDVAESRQLAAETRAAREWMTANGPLYHQAQQELPTLSQRRKELTEEVDRLLGERSELQMELTESRSQVQWQRQEVGRLTDEVEKLRQQEEALRVSVADHQAQESGIVAHLAEVNASLDARKGDVEDTQKRLSAVGEEYRRLTAEIAGVRAEHERRRSEIDQMRIEHQNVVKLIEAAEKRWSQLAPAAGGAEDDRMAEVWHPVLPAISLPDSNDTELAALNQTQEYIHSLGLRFPDRVIRAFHTSLKVADISPLVVLAGISGTGKSELPRRYSEGMGLHFLNIAVQPRWDSPQDMFGFYNYLENRYRATELTRSLIQMDPYYQESNRGWATPEGWSQHSRHKDMLLVLLDEMNLARVEYYFSEFLSRLETRRGVNASDAADRRKAEITLEVGLRALLKNRAGEAKPTMQLFVDQNVLFVGTMNEDESTQTLSDKVIDRANVLRFGKPAAFNGKGSNGHLVQRPQRVVRQAQWASWRKAPTDLAPDVSEQVDRWIQELNGAMHLIHKPFAHRTYSAIRSYIANYPDGQALQDAMADQIEQKILPKLRGLDPRDEGPRQAIQRVIDLLDELGDDQLVAAVEACRQQGDHLFSWQGLDRSEALATS